ncbi:hypothetical protein BC941DRAFT_457728 [Chlamydoabsidia padenii]|nr:hypothetical protein BC941DRAFT_457728 [Chlamydoabsidia padenii]
MRSDRFLSIFVVVALLTAVNSVEGADEHGYVSTTTITRTVYGTSKPMESSSLPQKDKAYQTTVHHTLDLPLPSQFSSLPQIIESLFPTHVPSSTNLARPSAPASSKEETFSKSMDNQRPAPIVSAVPPQPAQPQMSDSASPMIKEIHQTLMPKPATTPTNAPMPILSIPSNFPSNLPTHPAIIMPSGSHPAIIMPSGSLSPPNGNNNNLIHSLVSMNPGMMNSNPPPPMQTAPVIQVPPLGNNNQQISSSPSLQASSAGNVFNVWPTELAPPPPSASSSSAKPSSMSASSSADANNVNKKAAPSNNNAVSGASHVGTSTFFLMVASIMAAAMSGI